MYSETAPPCTRSEVAHPQTVGYSLFCQGFFEVIVTKLISSYWELLEPYFETINNYDGPDQFMSSIADVPRLVVLLYAAHMSSSEIHNGGFLQLFWNSTGVIAPDAIEAFHAMGMPILAALVAEASLLLGAHYPIDRDDRWDALLVESGKTEVELKRIFAEQSNFYLAFQEATSDLPFDRLNREFWKQVKVENGGLQVAATRYAQNGSHSL